MCKAKWKIFRKVKVVSVDMVGRRKGGWRWLLGEEREVEEDCWEKKGRLKKIVRRRKGGWRRLLGEEREVEEDC